MSTLTAVTAEPGPVSRPARAVGVGATILKRVGGAIFVLWAVATLSFFGMRLIPGDPVDALLGGPGSNATEAMRQEARELYGLDQPLLLQYAQYLGRLVSGDFGTSFEQKRPVAELIGEQFGSTLLLATAALAVAWILALGLALWSARGGRAAVAVSSFLEIVSAAVPQFWLGTILILLFAVSLRVLPATSGSASGAPGLVLPVLTLAIPLAGFLGQVMRESMLRAATSPFALSARARGETETGVSLRHALRHAALPGIGLSGWAFGHLISGAVVVETVFARPGLGRTLLQAVVSRDVSVVLGVVFAAAAMYVVVTIISDLAERVADPRLRAA